MTVDREQIRRAVAEITSGFDLAAIFDALPVLLADLEQAESRLAKVPALVEALKWYRGWAEPEYPNAEYRERERAIAEALAEWERE